MLISDNSIRQFSLNLYESVYWHIEDLFWHVATFCGMCLYLIFYCYTTVLTWLSYPRRYDFLFISPLYIYCNYLIYFFQSYGGKALVFCCNEKPFSLCFESGIFNNFGGFALPISFLITVGFDFISYHPVIMPRCCSSFSLYVRYFTAFGIFCFTP